jgi:hypothetical protein
MGKGAWWSVLLALLLEFRSIPNAVDIIPVVEALLGKRAACGAVFVFMKDSRQWYSECRFSVYPADLIPL